MLTQSSIYKEYLDLMDTDIYIYIYLSNKVTVLYVKI